MIAPAGPRGRTVAIPDSIARVDARWLTDALSITHPGLRVRSAKVLESLGQGGCTKLRVAVDTNRPEFPATVIVKGCLEPKAEPLKRGQLNEVRYYQHLVPSLGVETVQVLFSQGDDAGGSILVMEDLAARGAKCLRAEEPITDFTLAASFLTEIARFHAQWWGAPELVDGSLDWLAGPEASKSSVEKLQNKALFADKMTLPRAVAVPRLLKDPERLLAALNAVSSNPCNFPLTITHSGPFLQNLYVTADHRPGFFDWNLCRTAWAKDVAIFIVCCLDTLDRRRWEAALLQHYLAALSAHGIDAPDFDLAWQGYRGWPVHSAIVWLLNKTEWHSEVACTALAGRCTQAMIDLDTFGVLGV